MTEIKIYKLQDLEEMLGVSRFTIYKLIKSGELKAYKIGGQWRFNDEDVKAFLEKAKEA